jgi:hypothetical protein
MVPTMTPRLKRLRLAKAPQEDEAASYRRLMSFLGKYQDTNVSLRSEDVVRSTINDESMFFIENENTDIIATTGFYRHGERPNQWGEIGTTLVDPEYRGVGLQPAIYRHIIVLKLLSDWPPQPVIAVVDELAKGSWINIERCSFKQLTEIPLELLSATPNRNWDKVNSRSKRLYELDNDGIVDAIIYVADNGAHCVLVDKYGNERYTLIVEFPYLRQPGLSRDLRNLADEFRRTKA